MSDIQQAIEAVRRLREEATPGLNVEQFVWGFDGPRIERLSEAKIAASDAALIAAAPDLAASVERGYRALVVVRDWVREGIGSEAEAAEALDDAIHDFITRFSDEGRSG